MNQVPKLTVAIIAKNEAGMIADCLNTVSWADQLLVLDNGSIDQTAQLAEKLGAKVIHFEHNSFAKLRNQVLNYLETDWVFYLDADERVSPTLAKEIKVHLETNTADILVLKRKNYCYGQHLTAGGWQNDVVTRVFKRSALKEWTGNVHESPICDGTITKLSSPLYHLTHRNTQQNLIKSASWTLIEAKLIHKAGVSPVTFITLLRKGIMEFIRRAIIHKGYQDGLTGLIESLVQAINRVLVYIQVWELQQQPPIDEQYRRLEIEIRKHWEQERYIQSLATSKRVLE